MTTPQPRNNSASVRRALAILMHLSRADSAGGQSVTAIADAVGVNKSTAGRLLAPLLDSQLVERDPVTGHYLLGSRTAQLGQAYLDRLDVRSLARDALQSLAHGSGETAHLVVADFPDVVYVDKVDSPQAVRMHSRIGLRQPAYCTAVGKALLAQSPGSVVDAVVAAGLPARTAGTITDSDALHVELETTRRRGYAIDEVENEPGVRCVAAAIRDHTGAAVAALSISGPEQRLTQTLVSEWGPRVAQAAAEVSRKWGARP